jgi:hypothetical protein
LEALLDLFVCFKTNHAFLWKHSSTFLLLLQQLLLPLLLLLMTTSLVCVVVVVVVVVAVVRPWPSLVTCTSVAMMTSTNVLLLEQQPPVVLVGDCLSEKDKKQKTKHKHFLNDTRPRAIVPAAMMTMTVNGWWQSFIIQPYHTGTKWLWRHPR